jgi:hypothetical protein
MPQKTPNQAAPGNGGMTSRLAAYRAWPAVPEPRR